MPDGAFKAADLPGALPGPGAPARLGPACDHQLLQGLKKVRLGPEKGLSRGGGGRGGHHAGSGGEPGAGGGAGPAGEVPAGRLPALL